MTKETFEKLQKKFGKYGSWTIWDDDGRTESDTSGMEWAEKIAVSKLNTKFVFVGLNWSVNEANPNCGKPWWNSHGGKNDYKLRFALKDSDFWGCYMTDLVKDCEEPDSSKVVVDDKSLKIFREEIALIGKPVLIALGRKVESALKKNFGDEFEIVEIEHYANYGSKEDYKKSVMDALKKI